MAQSSWQRPFYFAPYARGAEHADAISRAAAEAVRARLDIVGLAMRDQTGGVLVDAVVVPLKLDESELRYLKDWPGVGSAGDGFSGSEVEGAPAASLEPGEVGGVLVRNLSDFSRGSSGYDWSRLAREFPSAKVVVRLSVPSRSSSTDHAVVRYDAFSPNSPSRTLVCQMERRNGGAWHSDARCIVW